MTPYRPRTTLSTHQITNQSRPLQDIDLFATDPTLHASITRQPHAAALSDFCGHLGRRAGSAEVLNWGHEANTHPPTFTPFDRFGQRIDEVEFHPAYHHLMDLAMTAGLPSIAWTPEGSHVGFAAGNYLFSQAEAGVVCPMTMTYASVPSVRAHQGLADTWIPKILTPLYDPRHLPIDQKKSATIGMAMTEKQGGSDVRQNATIATHTSGDDYTLLGHKWFCSAPMSDAFLTLAKIEDDHAPSCFFVPRWTPNGQRNTLEIKRLKDKLGNRSNASAEIEYHHTHATLVGPRAQGVKTIIEMVRHTRLACIAGSAGLMRQAVTQAIHHATHRAAFGAPLIRQPLMRQVLADLALESQAACLTMVRIAEAFDRQDQQEEEALARVGVTVGKYWVCKRAPEVTYEAMECLGGNGYVEEFPMARLFRESPLNSIWEGSGNVMSLDVLRAGAKEPETLAATLGILAASAGQDSLYDQALGTLRSLFDAPKELEARARLVSDLMARLLQASLMMEHAPSAHAELYLQTRLGLARGMTFGSLASSAATDSLIESHFRQA